MKEQLSNLYRFFILIILAATVQACGSDTPDPKAGFSISVDTESINLSNEFLQPSEDTIAITVNFTGNGLLLGYAPDASPVPWLNFKTENVTASSATVIVELVNVENILANLYKTKLRLSTGDVSNTALVHKDIDISLLIWEKLNFSATLGEAAIASQTVDINLDSADWTFSSDVEWLTVEPLTINGKTTLTVSPVLTEFTQANLYQGNITITENSSGDVDVIPVDLGVDNLYIVPSQETVAFTSTLNTQALTQTLNITSNSTTAVNWQASSNVPWLLLEQTESNSLMISVDQVNMPTEALNNAVITVHPIDNPAVISAEIAVSLYHSSLETKTTVLDELTLNNKALIAAVNAPYFYTAVANELRTYHQYTGELIATLSISPDESTLEQLILHPDGDILLAKAEVTTINDDDTTTTTTHRYKINLTNSTYEELVDSTIQYEPLSFVTFAGRHFVITQALEFADANLQRLSWDNENAFFINLLDQATDTDDLYVLDASTATFKTITARVNDFTTSKIIPTITSEYRPESLPETSGISAFVVNDNASALFLISETSEWITFDGESYIDQGLLTQAENNTALAINKDKHGNIAFTRYDPAIDKGIVVDVYDAQGSKRNSTLTGGQVPQAIRISHDSKQLIIQTNEQVELVPLDTVSVSAKSFEFLATFGDSNITEQTFTINNVSEQWQATSNVNWLTLTPNNVDGQAGLTLTIDTNNITGWGLFTGVITITDPATGNNIQLVVKLAIDEIRLFANYSALSFDQQLDRSSLTQTVSILTNKNVSVPWQATSNVNWLTLTENLTDNTLTVTVDPDKVSTNGLHYAEITLSPLSIDDSLTGTIAVSFNKGDFDSTLKSEITIEDVTPNSSAIVLDPLRPYLYVAQLDKIDVFNVIDGNKVSSIQSPLADVDLTNLVIHPNGSILLASNIETYINEQDEEQTRVNHYQINLTTFEITQLDDEKIDLTYRPNNIEIVQGKAIVVSQAMEYANMSLEVQFWDSGNAFLSTTIHKIPNTDSVLAYNNNSASIIESNLSVNTFAEKTISAGTKGSYFNPNFLLYGLSNFTTSNNGLELYTANPISEWATSIDKSYVDNGTLPSSQTLATIKVVTDSADNSYVYRKSFLNGYGEAHTFTQYDAQQQQTSFAAYSAGSNDAYISINYHRLIHFNGTALVIDYINQ